MNCGSKSFIALVPELLRWADFGFREFQWRHEVDRLLKFLMHWNKKSFLLYFFYLCEILTIGCHDNLHNQWVETNPYNICICPTDICFATWWYYTDGIDTDVKYRCLRMLDWLVSTHPITTFSVATISISDTQHKQHTITMLCHFAACPVTWPCNERPYYSSCGTLLWMAVSDLDPKRSMHRPVQVTHSSFIEGSHTTKNTAPGARILMLGPDSTKSLHSYKIVHVAHIVIREPAPIILCWLQNYNVGFSA
jgi:hypothetical protein